MRNLLVETLHPYGEEPITETAKRILGAGTIMLVSLPVSNKDGWTPQFAAHMSDTIGAYTRATINAVMSKPTDETLPTLPFPAQ